MPERITLPENYNPDTNLLAKTTENGTFHESRAGARLARNLLAGGHPEDVALAQKVLEATLACQETREDDPHRGNFYWMAEDDVVGDLNAVEFCLESLIPMMTDSADLLDPEMGDRVLAAIRLGLEEIARLDVRVTYSNITMLDILNTCLGGELLEDERIAGRGYDKLDAWIAYTDRSGTPREYNSPTYTRVCVNALAILSKYLKHEEYRVRARTFAARVGLTVGLHIHPSTGRWAGPHSRAYHPTVICEGPPEIEAVRRWIDDGALPEWVGDLISSEHLPFEVRETASVDELGTLSTCMSPSWSLGVASVGYGGQSNTILSHFVRKNADRPGVFFSRYLTNDKWLGDFYHATDRTKSRNLIDEGKFLGVQNRNRAIALYAPQNLGVVHSVKSSYVWTERDRVDEILIVPRLVDFLGPRDPDAQTTPSGDTSPGVREAIPKNVASDSAGVREANSQATRSVARSVAEDPSRVREANSQATRSVAPPHDVSADEVVVVASGDALFAVLPLSRTDIGRQAPIRLVERGGDLVLDIHNYLGPEKAFWEMRPEGPFFQGYPKNGAYVEVAERSAWESAEAFGKAVASGSLTDRSDEPFVDDGESERLWTVSYERDGELVGIDADLMKWKLKRRWTETGDLELPMLTSPLAAQSKSGTVKLAGAVAEASSGPVWMVAPEADTWIVGYHGPVPTDLTLTVPDGHIEIPRITAGVICWREGRVTVDGAGITNKPTVEGATLET